MCNVFFLIVGATLLVSIGLVYLAVRRIGFELSPIPLVACAIISVAISKLAIGWTSIPGNQFWVNLTAMVLLGAALLTAVNHFLIERVKRADEEFQAEVETAYAEQFAEEPVEEVAEEPDEQPELGPMPETMEALFEYATAAKDRDDVETAIIAYQKILREYGTDEYAPFVAIDLSNLFKERANYADAIATCEFALSLPAVNRSATMSKEFAKNLDYLKVVQEVLTKHDALSTPFSEIPADILAEIESAK